MKLTSKTALNQAARFLRNRLGPPPDLAIVFGSGLGEAFLKKRKPETSLSYSSVPHFQKVSVAGHPGLIHFLKRTQQYPVAAVVLQGRRHYYEGPSAEAIVFPYRALAIWGVRQLVLTNASGSLRRFLRTGTLAWIKDHINLTGVNPLRGPNLDFLGPRFPVLKNLYRNSLSERLRRVAKREGIALPGAVYMAIAGPSYETDAEIRAYQKLGGDLVGMSTALEAIAARHAGMEVAALAAVTNSCLGSSLPKGPPHEDVLKQAAKVDKKMARLLLGVSKQNWSPRR
jgi:purine-nucleoside phosphorylase